MKAVEVTWHALNQYKERFPEEGGTNSYLRMKIAEEVQDALTNDRYATRQPQWASRTLGRRPRGRRNGNEIDRSMRFCWTTDARRLYLVDKHSGLVRVVTTIRPWSGDKQDA